MKANENHPVIGKETFFEKKGKKVFTKRIFVNEKYCQLYGYSLDEFQDQFFRNGFPQYELKSKELLQ